MALSFTVLEARLFTSEELAEYLWRALSQLDETADAGCENVPPGSEPTCGDCASCMAEKLITEVNAETGRRTPKETTPST